MKNNALLCHLGDISILAGKGIIRLQTVVLGGPRKVVSKWSQDQALFESWRDGRTGYGVTPIYSFEIWSHCPSAF